MAGCCSDWYADSYANADVHDPKGSATAGPWHRVLRGGAWSNTPQICRAPSRGRITADYPIPNLGFRVVVVSGSGVD